MRPTRAALSGALVVVALYVAAAAAALWMTSSATTTIVSGDNGTVGFAAQEWSTQGSLHRSLAGQPVQVTMPAAEVNAGLDRGWTIWQFQVTGYAQGAVGLDFDISVPEAPTGTARSLGTTTVYQSFDGDCSSVPPEQPSLADQTLVERGTDPAGTPTTQTWCVAVVWPVLPDSLYANTVWATGVATDLQDLDVTALDSWDAAVAIQNSVLTLGDYVNRADAAGEDDTSFGHESSAVWDAAVLPDPTREPPVVITISPKVTNPNPGFTTGNQDVP